MFNHRFLQFLYFFTITVLAISCKESSQKSIPAISFPVVEIESQQVDIAEDYVGQVYGFIDIPIRTRVDGYVEGIHFKEGSRVREGQLLYSIDRQPFLAEVARMKSTVAEAMTNLAKAENDLNRVRLLDDIRAVSTADLDAAVANYEAAEASLDAAKANLRLAEIELGYTRIKSPISGIIGKSMVEIGEYVGRSITQTSLNTVSRTDSVRVEFFITENDYLRLARYDILTEETGRSRNKATLNLVFSDNSVFEYEGKYDFANREIDASTGALLIQTSFPNPKNFIKPGQFVKVRVGFKTENPVVLVPQRSIRELQGQYSVFRVVNDTIKETFIEKGRNYKDLAIVESGLNTGDKVIIEGLQKIRNGMPATTELVEFESKVVDNE
jgi:membrane fusion protein (multidrug efflux system)